MGLGSALLRLGGVWIQSVGGVKRLIALYYGKIYFEGKGMLVGGTHIKLQALKIANRV